MNPGPATETSTTSSCAASVSATRAARSRGFIPAVFARTSATLLDTSPWRGSRGGSTEKSASDTDMPRSAATSSTASLKSFLTLP